MRVLGPEGNMSDRPLALLCWCLLLHRATGFIAPARSVGRPVTAGTVREGCYVNSVRPCDPLFLAPDSMGEADIPGAADSRLAGWRVASPTPDGPEAADGGEASTSETGEPGCGDVVEYPLSNLVKEEANDGREKGVAVIVSINKQRNDAWKLPEDILDKAELQVLCPDLESGDEGAWMVDELETCAFAFLGEMKVLQSDFNGALDKWKRWTVHDELSEGCGARDAEWEYDML